MEVCSSPSQYLLSSSPLDSDDVSYDATEAEPSGSPAAAAAAGASDGDTPPPSSPADDVTARLYLMQRRHHHDDALSPHLTVNKPLQTPSRTCCSLDVASIIATDNRATLLDNR